MLIINTAKIPEDGAHFDGVEDGAILELDGDPFTQAGGPVGYRLFARTSPTSSCSAGPSRPTWNASARVVGNFSRQRSDSSFLRAYDISEGWRRWT